MATSQKCAHKGCGKVFTDPEEPCVYHPGPPEFHEGQKGWKCCKTRVLTFDEFLEIPPCTTGKHSTVDENAEAQARAEKEKREKAAQYDEAATATAPVPKRVPLSQSTANAAGSLSAAMPTPAAKPASPAPELEEDSDDPSTPIPEQATCKRRSCGRSSKDSTNPREEDCVYHPGVPIFHEGSKGWSCCKRRVLEFDEFMKISGCKTRKGHCFVGKRTKKQQQQSSTGGGSGTNSGGGTAAATAGTNNTEESITEVRNDFYQTASSLIVSFYLKKIDRDRASVTFRDDGSGVDLDLPTTDGKRFVGAVDTWADIVAGVSQFKIMGTKLEMTLAKKEGGVGWPVLRKGDRDYGERIQIGKAGRA